jgi:riboflavin synthase
MSLRKKVRGYLFTGIVEEVGKIKRIEKGAKSCILTIEADKVLEGSKVGDSIAVNGVCLTATTISAHAFTADVMAETVRRSSLGQLLSGSRVNLERAMAADGRFGGHIVSGHIDGTGTITDMTREDNAVWVTISCSSKLLKYIIEKGSITIDGISLTVAYVDSRVFKVSIIPHTASETTLMTKKPGDIVNLENDIIGKYVEKLLYHNNDSKNDTVESSSTTSISMDFLSQNGFM